MTDRCRPYQASLCRQAVRRREDLRFITGRGRYVDDVKVTGLLHMAVLRSSHAHATIARIDLSRARRRTASGLHCRARSLSGKIGAIVPNWIIPGTKVPHRPVIAIDRVRFVGECVAIVVADQLEQALSALELIDVDYEPLPAVVDEVAAIRDGAVQLHDNVPHNITTLYKVSGGNYAAAASEADQPRQAAHRQQPLDPDVHGDPRRRRRTERRRDADRVPAEPGAAHAPPLDRGTARASRKIA